MCTFLYLLSVNSDQDYLNDTLVASTTKVGRYHKSTANVIEAWMVSLEMGSHVELMSPRVAHLKDKNAPTNIPCNQFYFVGFILMGNNQNVFDLT